MSSTPITSMSIVGASAVIVDRASVNGVGDYPLLVTVTNNDSPGINRDLFGLKATPAVSLNPAKITRGKIQVHWTREAERAAFGSPLRRLDVGVMAGAQPDLMNGRRAELGKPRKLG